MDEKDWRFLKVLYEEKNITKAAETEKKGVTAKR